MILKKKNLVKKLKAIGKLLKLERRNSIIQQLRPSSL